MTELAISIVNHNSVAPLRRCLRSLLEPTGDVAAEIYVVDNLCEQPAREMVRAEFPGVTVLENARTLGFGANNNQVLRRTMDRCAYVLLLNPDTMAPPGAIRRMLDYMAAHPRTAICGPQLVDESGAATPPLRRFLSWPREVLYLGLHLSNSSGSPGFWKLVGRLAGQAGAASDGGGEPSGDGAGEQPSPPEGQPQQAVSGACLLIRSAALREIGLFDERFFLYFEEIDLCVRAWERGWEVAFLPGVEVMHAGGYSTAPRRHDYLRVYVASCLYLYRKHRGYWAAQGLRAWVGSVALANLLRWSLLYALQPRRRDELGPWLKFSARLVREL